MTVVQHTLASADIAASSVERGSIASTPSPSSEFVGLAVMALLPAVFWPSVMAVAGTLAGAPFAAQTLLLTGILIAAFLAGVCSPLIKRATVQSAMMRATTSEIRIDQRQIGQLH